MAGTKSGAKKAHKTMVAKYGLGFYKAIGRKGGKNGNTGGFAYDYQYPCQCGGGCKSRGECAGRKGGRRKRDIMEVYE